MLFSHDRSFEGKPALLKLQKEREFRVSHVLIVPMKFSEIIIKIIGGEKKILSILEVLSVK